MEFNEIEKKSMNIARESIFRNFKKNCPNLYDELWQEVKNGVLLPEGYAKNYSEDEKYEIIAKNRIKDKIRNEFIFLKSVMENTLEIDFSEQQIGELLEILFYFDNENKEPFYRDDRKTRETNFKSINAQVKKGDFWYRYDEIYKSCIEIANKYREIKINPYTSYDEDKKIMADFYQNWLRKEQLNIKRLCEARQYTYVKKALSKWLNIIMMGNSLIIDMEKKNAFLLYAYYCWNVIIESVSEVLYDIYQTVLSLKKRKLNIEVFFNKVLEASKDRCISITDTYDLIQDYWIHMEMYNFRKERQFFNFIIDNLQKEKYENFNKTYDVRRVDINTLTIRDIKEKFCESCSVRADIFKERYETCKKIYDWYQKQHLEYFGNNESVALKAIYRECFIYKQIPSEVDRGGVKAFVNKIQRRELTAAPNMKEIEMFMREKIRRGVKREENAFGKWYTKGVFMRQFHQFEEELVTTSKMRGYYMSDWINIIVKNLIIFLINEI